MTGKTVDFDEYRMDRGKDSRVMWRHLNWVFDTLGIPGVMRHALMFMDQETYLAWGRDERIVSLEKINLAARYTRLQRALRAMCGDDDRTIHHWLFTENNGYPSLFKGRSPIETILEDGERVVEDVIGTLRTQQ